MLTLQVQAVGAEARIVVRATTEVDQAWTVHWDVCLKPQGGLQVQVDQGVGGASTGGGVIGWEAGWGAVEDQHQPKYLHPMNAFRNLRISSPLVCAY